MKKRIAMVLTLVVAFSQTNVFAMQQSEYAPAEYENVELFATYGNFEYTINNSNITITGYNGTDTNIIIPSEINGKAVTQIGDSAFYDCTDLESITIPNSVIQIGDSAFFYCSSLESVTIPKNVTQIGLGVFASCSNLQQFNVSADNENYTSKEGSLFNKDMTKLISYPAGREDTEYKVPDSVTEIDGYAFCESSNLNSITIPNSVTIIGENAFRGCSDLENITIPNSLKEISNHMFWSCSDLKSIIIPKSVTTIGKYAFYSCTSLESITMSDSITEIGVSAFGGCDGLKSVKIPDSVTKIGEFAFSTCNSLKSITIPDKVTEINDYTFLRCLSLENVKIGNSVTKIGRFAFQGCTNLESVIIPQNVTQIDDKAFQECNNLTIYGYTDSYANQYANAKNIPFLPLLVFGDITIEKPTIDYAENKVTVNVSVNNGKENSEKFLLYAVGYKDGAIVGIKQIIVTDNNYNESIEFDVSEKPEYVKVFAFDAVNGTSPLCKAEKTELK